MIRRGVVGVVLLGVLTSCGARSERDERDETGALPVQPDGPPPRLRPEGPVPAVQPEEPEPSAPRDEPVEPPAPVSSPPTPTSPSRLACSAVEYESRSPGPSQSRECTRLTQCGAGDFEAIPPTATSDRVCSPCSPGRFNSEINALGCRRWADCGAGQFVEVEPTDRNDRQCGRCRNGQYSTANNAARCTDWTVCGPDEFEVIPGTIAQDRRCASRARCPSGSVAATDGTGCAPCPAGTASAQDSETCVPCAPGTFSSAGAGVCTLWHVCGAGEYETVAPSPSTDRRCELPGCGLGDSCTLVPPTGPLAACQGKATTGQCVEFLGSDWDEYALEAERQACLITGQIWTSNGACPGTVVVGSCVWNLGAGAVPPQDLTVRQLAYADGLPPFTAEVARAICAAQGGTF
jgi:hypothetical protein